MDKKIRSLNLINVVPLNLHGSITKPIFNNGPEMKETTHIYSLLPKINACFMILALLSLTISAPLSFSNQFSKNSQTGHQSQIPVSAGEEESTNPLGNNTEEKVPAGANPLEEFLHDSSDAAFIGGNDLRKFDSRDADIFIDFHQELLVPPPNFS